MHTQNIISKLVFSHYDFWHTNIYFSAPKASWYDWNPLFIVLYVYLSHKSTLMKTINVNMHC